VIDPTEYLLMSKKRTEGMNSHHTLHQTCAFASTSKIISSYWKVTEKSIYSKKHLSIRQLHVQFSMQQLHLRPTPANRIEEHVQIYFEFLVPFRLSRLHLLFVCFCFCFPFSSISLMSGIIKGKHFVTALARLV
jgi:hypothetical protein